MPRTNEKILSEVRELKSWLYGDDGHEGDIPEIKQHLANLNDHLDDHSKRIVIVETKVEERTASKVSKKAMVGYGGGIAVVVTILFAIGQIMGWW